ncbi:hypothetical protein [Paracoccus sp. TOH]|uniref:hypothetical protein n=1 Tax=Paracoccus sp. TOH TaxID=1263728 RepID=UPI0025B26BB2|nr:hypothetical protein [Paracoccus sp. TOH]WJS87281.1 hypothetical protein NBE95_20595 [Paracoccus sp. TOH]
MSMLLFDKKDLPRRAPLKRMRVEDAGVFPDGKPCIQFVCPHCGYDTDWIYDTWTISENRRGLPCPRCNPDSPEGEA